MSAPNSALSMASRHIRAFISSRMQELEAEREAIKTSLGSITQKHFAKEFCVNVLTINPDIESRLASASRELFGETERLRLLESILRSVTEAGDLASEIVLVTRPEARKQLRDLITKEIPMLPVISYRDLSPDANVRPVGQITCDMLPRDH